MPCTLKLGQNSQIQRILGFWDFRIVRSKTFKRCQKGAKNYANVLQIFVLAISIQKTAFLIKLLFFYVFPAPAQRQGPSFEFFLLKKFCRNFCKFLVWKSWVTRSVVRFWLRRLFSPLILLSPKLRKCPLAWGNFFWWKHLSFRYRFTGLAGF